MARDTQFGELFVFLIEILLHIFSVVAHDLHGLGHAVQIQVALGGEGVDQVVALHGVGGVDHHQYEEHTKCESDDDGDIALRARDRVVDGKEAARTGAFRAG